MSATHTTNLGLNKPDRQDYVSVVTDINDNMDMIDTALHGLDTGKVPNTRKVNGHALSSDVTVTKGDVGLGNCDNTSDANKPVSTAQQAALDLKINTSAKGAANGIASLDASGKVPSSQLPSYVDDVVEGYLYNGQFYKESSHTTLITPEGDKIYVDIPTSSSYRWSGSLYVKIDDPKEIIDDNAGIGDTDLVYSADKVVKLFKEEHEHLTAGSALQLLGQYTDENVPYVFRKTPVNSKRVREKLVGGTVAWNQLIPITSSSFEGEQGGVTVKGNGDGSVDINGTCTKRASVTIINGFSHIVDHKYFQCGWKQIGTNTGFFGIGGTAVDRGNGGIINGTSGTWNIRFDFYLNDVYNHVTVYPMIIDLTAMFGSTIADAIYAMETATAGSGVAWFRSLFPKDYYAYNAGELMSVQAASKKTIGFNQWDEEWEVGGYWSNGSERADENQARAKNYIPVLPNTIYATNKGIAFILYFDSNKNLISVEDENTITKQFITPSNCRYVKFSVSKELLPICINISDLTKNGTYEPYDAHTYPLDSSLTLRGISKWDSTSGKMYYDGDRYEADGKVTRKYGIVDLGSIDWSYNGSGDNRYFSSGTQISNIRRGANINEVFYICSKYLCISPRVTADIPDKCLCKTVNEGEYIFIKDSSYSDAAAFKTAMSGVYLVYELATPTTETADPYQEVQICDGNGTEEFVDGGNRDVSVPVGHESKYSADIWQIIADLQAAILALQS